MEKSSPIISNLGMFILVSKMLDKAFDRLESKDSPILHIKTYCLPAFQFLLLLLLMLLHHGHKLQHWLVLSLANATAIAFPIPLLPPVTSAFLSFNPRFTLDPILSMGVYC